MKKHFSILLAVVVSGILGVIIYPTVLFGTRLPDLGFLAWVYLVPMLVVSSPMPGGRIFLWNFISALIGYFGSLYWLIPAMTNFGGLSLSQSAFVLVVVILILSLYFSLAVTLAFWVHRKRGLPLFFLIPVFVSSFDFLRTHFPVGGFPWPMPVYSQGAFLPFFQWVDVTGAYGLNFLLLLVNGLVAEILMSLRFSKERDRLINRSAILFFVMITSFGGGILRQEGWESGKGAGPFVELALLQGNIAQDIKWNPRKAHENLKTYLELTDRAAANGVEAAIWPETAYSYPLDLYNLLRIPFLDRNALPVPVLMGTVSLSPIPEGGGEPWYYNSAFLVGTDLRMRGVYHKRHLVPYGEYVPFKKWLGFLQNLTQAVGDFTPGADVNIMEEGNLKIGNLICYEDIFPGLARSVARAGANLLVNITNDAWYGNTSAQHQHLVFSQFRALENRRYLVRATNTGMTAVIDDRGMVIDHLPPFKADLLMARVPLLNGKTFYQMAGDWVSWICVLGALASLVYGLKAWIGNRGS